MKPGNMNFCAIGRRSPELTLVASIILLSMPFGEVSSAATHPVVSPYQDFSNSILQIRAPGSDGWSGIIRTSDRIAFGKSGLTPSETFVAAVVVFRTPLFANSEAFTAYVREGVIKDSPSDRFEVIESNFEYSSERNYPCVRYHGITSDRKVRIAPFFHKTMRLEVFALYCQHPTKPGLAFSASFSHRGGSVDATIDTESADFIDMVQIIPPGKVP
jgi:hypothetical protein